MAKSKISLNEQIREQAAKSVLKRYHDNTRKEIGAEDAFWQAAYYEADLAMRVGASSDNLREMCNTKIESIIELCQKR